MPERWRRRYQQPSAVLAALESEAVNKEVVLNVTIFFGYHVQVPLSESNSAYL